MQTAHQLYFFISHKTTLTFPTGTTYVNIMYLLNINKACRKQKEYFMKDNIFSSEFLVKCLTHKQGMSKVLLLAARANKDYLFDPDISGDKAGDLLFMGIFPDLSG